MQGSSSLPDGQCARPQGHEDQPADNSTPPPSPPRSRIPRKLDPHAQAPPAASSPKPSSPTTPVSRRQSSIAIPKELGSPLRQSFSTAQLDDPGDPFEESFSQSNTPKMPLTGDNAAAISPDGNQNGRDGAFSSRRSRPVGARSHTAHAAQTKPTGSPSSNPVPASAARPKTASPAIAPRFSFFSSLSLKGPAPSSVAVPHDDELINLDIEASLFPAGAPADGDTFSPAAYKNLHLNAVGLLRKFQSAYQDRTIALHELRAEREAQDDEKIELETRSHHLKLQLEGMAQKATEIESTMRSLMEELTTEKRLRVEERHARDGLSSNISVSEDLGVEDDQMRERRRSGATSKTDQSSETDAESVEEASLFSRSRSPTVRSSITDATSAESAPMSAIPPKLKRSSLELPPTAKPQQQLSAFQRLFRAGPTDGARNEEARLVYSCRNCEGQDSSIAWNTVSLLRDENKGLKKRVGELESAVEDVLDAVNGVGMSPLFA
ncbi:Heavy metal tolerance protein [Purpureocillium lavendulum]|uniref:Heavy metal tolerance protein n=1 Tax=Purpureocillium lavendulum TaxID=1247861 RepID=A0AB34G2I9_9HYPO|nr:Heavy metal tolerance protein [Purpureocillium lavendulum]